MAAPGSSGSSSGLRCTAPRFVHSGAWQALGKTGRKRTCSLASAKGVFPSFFKAEPPLLPWPGSNGERRKVSAGLGKELAKRAVSNTSDHASGLRKPQGCRVRWDRSRAQHQNGPWAAARSLQASGTAPAPPAARPLPPSRHQRPVQTRTAPTIRLPAPRARPPRADAEHGGRSGSKNEPLFSHPKQGKGSRISSRVPSRRASASKHLSRGNRKRAFKKVHEI